MVIKFIGVKNDPPILDQYHYEKRNISYMYTYFNMGNTRTTTIALCNTVENLYLIIIYVVVAFLLFHIIVDFYCNYYCICI